MTGRTRAAQRPAAVLAVVHPTGPRLAGARLAAASALVLAAAAGAQGPASGGITPRQVVALQRVSAVIPMADRIAFTREVPRPPGEPAGPARTHLFVIDPDGSERALLTGDWSVRDAQRGPGDNVTFIHRSDGDAHPEVWGVSVDGGEPKRLTTTPNGVDAHLWSPDQRICAIQRTAPRDATAAALHDAGFRMRVVDEDDRPRELWLYHLARAQARKVDVPGSVWSMAWSHDGERLAVGVSPRNTVDDRYMFQRLHVVDVAGVPAVRQIADNPGKLGALEFSPDGSRLAYLSAADRNDPHAGTLFVTDLDGGEPVILNAGFAGMLHDIAWHPADDAGPERLRCTASIGVEDHLLELPLGGGEPSVVLELPGLSFRAVHTARLGAREQRVVVASSAEHPDEVFAIGGDGEAHRLTDSNPWLDGVALGRQEVLRYTARDGLALEGILIHPVGDAAGRAPLVVIAHGGPESHWSNGWNTSYSRWGQALAARGYLVFMPNYRASTGYGVAFAKADHGDIMGREFDDVVDGVDVLIDRGLADPARVGIGGGSYGGFMAAWAATRHSPRFAAAVAFVPVTDITTKTYTTDIPFESHLVHQQETWPFEAPGIAADRSPLTWAEHCATPLLLLGGTDDTRVHPSQPLMLYRAIAFATDTPVRLVQYPGEGHGNRINTHRYDHLLRTLRWFDVYLAAGDRRTAPLPPLAIDLRGWR